MPLRIRTALAATLLILGAPSIAGAEANRAEAAVEVETVLPGASRDAIARDVTPKLEDRLGAAQGLKFMVSMSRAGRMRVVLKFKPRIDGDSALADVRARLASALGALPPASAPVAALLPPAAQPLAFVAFSSDVEPPTQLTRIVEPWVGALAATDHVALVHLHGSRMTIIRIEADSSRLAAYGLTASDVVAALRQKRVTATPEFGSTDSAKLVIWPPVENIKVEDLGQVVLKLVQGSPVRLGDVAVVRLDARDDGIVARFDGRLAILAEVQRRPGVDVEAATRALRTRVADIEQRRPATIRIDWGLFCEACAVARPR